MRGLRRIVREQSALSYMMRDRRWVPIFICILASALLWFVTTLSAPSGYTKQVRIALLPPDFPADYVVTDSTDFPKEIVVDIHAPGGTLFKYSIRHFFEGEYAFKPVVDTLALNPDGGEWRLSIQELKTQVLSHVLQDVRRIVSDTIQSVIVSPAEIALRYMPLMEQPIEVVFGSQVDYGDRANLRLVDSVDISPSVVQIYGSADRLLSLRDTHPFVQTDTTAIKLSSPGQTSHKLALLAPAGTRVYPDSVTVILTTEELMHYTRDVRNIEVDNLPAGYSIKLLPSTVKVTYLIPKIIGTDEEPIDIRLYVDAERVLSADKKLLDVKIRNIPKGVEMIQLVPDQLEFILTELPKK